MRGLAGGYHLEPAALDLSTLPLAGFPWAMWGRELGFIIDHYDRRRSSRSALRQAEHIAGEMNAGNIYEHIFDTQQHPAAPTNYGSKPANS